ncbi:MAG TPA: hypothetical protein VIO61_05770 [Anaerolineaceae bacterium]
MEYKDRLYTTTLDWLLEEENPSVRHLALRDLVGLEAGSSELMQARLIAHKVGAIPAILEKMDPSGFWVKPGAGYSPKYKSTVWAVNLLAQLGAQVGADERIDRACAYVLDHTLADGRQFSYNGAPGGTIDCLHGNLTWSLQVMGCTDPRLEQAYDWMARMVTGEGIASQSDRTAELRFYEYKCGPNFACGANDRKSCAWGAVKVMKAFGSLPKTQHTPLIQRAIQQGIDFLFSVDPATAAYPSGGTGKPNLSWWKFGFPIFYITDLLQIGEVLARLGLINDPRATG